MNMENKSEEFKTIVLKMIKELSAVKYCYKPYIEGLYDNLIEHYHFSVPKEGKDACVQYSIDFFKTLKE